ncbi:MAG TPA: hypothetical protein VGI40_26195 [Pirellulaceae bacterium]
MPVRAILWQIYWRNRWGFAVAAAYLLMAITTSHLLTPYARTHWGDGAVTMVGLYLGAPCALIIVMVIASFCMSGNRMGEVCPPTHMLVLPVSSRMLVTVPMAAGAATVAVVWLIVAYFVLRPADVTAPILAPTAALTLFLTVFQALAWTPFAQKWIQGILTVVAGAATFGWVLGGIAFGFNRFGPAAEPFVAAFLVLALVPIAYWFALNGVTMGRRGDSYDWRLWSRLMERLAAWRKPAEHPFSSASAAQVWLELRSIGWYPPVMTLGVTLSFAPVVLLADPSDLGQTWKFLGIFVGLAILMATVSGGAMGNIGGIDVSAKSSYESFLFARPISSPAVVRDKFLMGVLSTLAVWLAALPMGLLIFLRPGFGQTLMEIARQTPAWKVAVLPPLIAFFLLCVTWKQMVEGFWIGLTGRPWLVHLFTTAMVLLIIGGMGFGIWVNIYTDYQPLAKSVVPWIAAVCLVVKLVAAVFVMRALLSSQLLPIEHVGAMVALWVLIVALLGSISLWLVPSGAASMLDILGGIILLVPFSRLAGAPLAVEWNRHR